MVIPHRKWNFCNVYIFWILPLFNNEQKNWLEKIDFDREFFKWNTTIQF